MVMRIILIIISTTRNSNCCTPQLKAATSEHLFLPNSGLTGVLPPHTGRAVDRSGDESHAAGVRVCEGR
jgi:hypothetical protein